MGRTLQTHRIITKIPQIANQNNIFQSFPLCQLRRESIIDQPGFPPQFLEEEMT